MFLTFSNLGKGSVTLFTCKYIGAHRIYKCFEDKQNYLLILFCGFRSFTKPKCIQIMYIRIHETLSKNRTTRYTTKLSNNLMTRRWWRWLIICTLLNGKLKKKSRTHSIRYWVRPILLNYYSKKKRNW